MAHQQPPGFGYVDFEPNHELYSLQAGMEMLGLPSKAAGSTSTGSGRYHNDGLMVAPEAAASNPWQQQPSRLIVDEYSSLRCLLPSHGGAGQPSQGLSLSLWNPDHHLQKPASIHHQQVQYQDARYVQAAPQAAGLRSSKYLVPAQELLGEFCNLKESGGPDRTVKKGSNQWEDGASSSSSSALYSMDLLELQKRKAKLLSMLEEVDRRYKRYSEQMRAVVSSFEAVAGEGSATVYSTLASKAMSRHFRCLRDGIVGQVQATKKAMGEKEPAVPGSTKGETPRLRLLDQCIRQQKAFQQAGVMESHPWRPQRGLPERSVSVLRAWLFEHFLHPYPSDVDKHILARQTGLSRSQVSNWFINARVRLWKPMVEEMYLEETKDPDNQSSDAAADHEDDNSNKSSSWPSQNPNPNPNPNSYLALQRAEDQKPLLIDSDSLSSIVSTSRDPRGSSRVSFQQHDPVPRSDNFGMVDHLDFSSYNDCGSSGGGRSFGTGVSLTLGLNQHNEGGMNLSFSQPNQHSLYFSREHVEDCQPVQFSILDGDQAQHLPYRNLMGAQLLHDLAG